MSTYQINPAGPYFQYTDLPPLQVGDVVKAERGYNYDKLNISNLSGVTFGSYGTGPEPTFGSLKTAAVFAHAGSGRWTFTDAALGQYLNLLVIDGLPKKKGRFPKNPDEYFPITADTVIPDPDNPSDNYLTHGALPFTASGEVVVRLENFITNTYSVVSDTGGIISYPVQNGQYPPKAGFGFALQNQIECLTEVGDWCYNASTKTVTVYLGASNPSDFVIQYPTAEEALVVQNSNNLMFSGINFVGSNGDGGNISNTPNIAFVTCNIKYNGGMGIRISDANCDDVTFSNVRVDHAFAGGIYTFFGCDRVKAIDSKVYNIGMVEGGSRYMNFDGRSNGFTIEGGENNIISNCRAEHVGFNAFVFGGNGGKVLNNIAKYFCSKKSDGAGFYTYAGNPGETVTESIIFTNNIAVYGIGNAFGTLDETPNCQGGYLDNGSNGVKMYNNLFAFNPTGLYMHHTRDCEVTNNFMFGNSRQMNMVKDTAQSMFGNTYSGNWHITTDINQEMGSVYGTDEEVGEFGTFSGNKYSNFKTGKSIFSFNDGSEPKPFKFAVNPLAWVSLLGETGFIFENYDQIPYEIVSLLGSIDYKTTVPEWNQTGAISGGGVTATQDENGLTVTKNEEPKTAAFLRLGPVEAGKWYLVDGVAFGNYNDLQVELEPNYTPPGDPIKNSKIDSVQFALPLFSNETRAADQFYLLMEKECDSVGFEQISYSEITVSRTVSTAVLEIDEENFTWEIALSGVFPPEPEPEPETEKSLIDSAIEEINNHLSSSLTWLSNAFGKAQKLVRENEKRQKIVYPAVFDGSLETLKNDYQNVLPIDTLGNFCFWFFDDPMKVKSTLREIQLYEQNVGLIFWFDLRTIYPDYPNRDIDLLKEEILEVVLNGFFKKSRFTIAEINEMPENVYKGFTISEIKSQFAMHPYGCLKFSGKLIVQPTC